MASVQPELRPRDRLDRRIEEGRLKPRHVRAIAKELARAHQRGAVAGTSDAGASPGALARRWRDAARALEDLGAISVAERKELDDGPGATPVRKVDQLLARHDTGCTRVRCLAPEPSSVTVRGRHAKLQAAPSSAPADVAEDLGRLSGALRRAGHAALAEQLLAAYALAADDYGLYDAIDFYECLSACTRAAVGGARGARAEIEPWLEGRTPGADLRPALILLIGRVASGKSTLAKALVRRLAAPRVVADRVRNAVLDPIAAAAGAETALERAWSEAFDERVYAGVLQRAGAVLRSGRSCMIDACSPTRHARSRVAELAEAHGIELLLCTCLSSNDRALERLLARDARDGVEEGSWARIARDLDTHFEDVAGDEAGRHVVVRTGEALDRSVADVVAALTPTPKARPRWSRGSALPGAVTFDCWNTLIEERDWTAAHRLRVEALHAATIEDRAECELGVVSEAFDRAWLRHMELWREGVASGAREVARWSMELLGIPLAEPVIAHLTERFQEASHSGDVVALEGAAATLERLRSAGVPMALVCDTGLTPGRVVRRHLDRLGLLDPLAAQLFSDEVGVPKPDPLIFHAALEAIGAEPATAVHVGDLLHTDIAGARGMGMRSVRLSASHDDEAALAEADAVADSHEALRELLGLD